MQFTPDQLKAIDISRLGQDACIVAGPGSGKTTVLVERYRQLVASGVEPSRILAITFTEKAAANMRRKLAEQFADNPEVLRKLERAYVSTIHGFCSRLLKENPTAAGVDPEFGILDEQLAALEQARALRVALDEIQHGQPAQVRALLEAIDGADLESLILPIYDALRAAGMRPSELGAKPLPPNPGTEEILKLTRTYLDGFPSLPNPKQREARDQAAEWMERVQAARSPIEMMTVLAKPAINRRVKNSASEEARMAKELAESQLGSLLDQAYAPQKNLLVEIFERFDQRYRARKTELVRLDFSDLEFFAVRMLEDNPSIRQQINDNFRLVITDEFQDTSGQQSKLMELVRGPGRFYAVGDLNQSIYGFRHASPEVFQKYLEAVKAAGAHAAELVENWRSREPILLATQTVLNGCSGITKRELVPGRILEPLPFPSVEAMICDRTPEDETSIEAPWIANRIAELHATLRIPTDIAGEQRPARFSDFAILVRNWAVIDPFLAAFDRAGIPYNLNRRTGFLETREARDLTHLVRVIANARDEVSLLAFLRSAFAGISDEGLLRLSTPENGNQPSIAGALSRNFDAVLDPEDRLRFDRIHTAVARWRAAATYVPLDRLILRALDEMGIAFDPGTVRGANIEKFLNIARTYADMSVREFAAHLEAMRRANPRESDSPIDETLNAVQLMTVHAAKGLEFPIVVIAGMEKGVDTSSAALNFTPLYGLGVKWLLPGGDDLRVKTSPGAVHCANQERIEASEKAESERLLYVAVTRAEEHLILSWNRKNGKLEHWAKLASTALALDDATPGVTHFIKPCRAPNGREFDLRVFCASGPPDQLIHPESITRTVPEPLVLDPPAIREQVESDVTASALSQFASCPRKYYLGSYLGWKGDLLRPRVINRPGDSVERAADIGTEVHALLAGQKPLQPNIESMRLAQVFERSPIGRKSEKASRREHEWDFIFALHRLGTGDLVLRGTVDLWFEDSAGLTIVDYKTDHIQVADVPARARDYELQLQIYALALSRATGHLPRQAVLHFLRPDVVFPVATKDAEQRVSSAAVRLRAAQNNLDFPLNPGQHCRRCEFFRSICPAQLPV